MVNDLPMISLWLVFSIQYSHHIQLSPENSSRVAPTPQSCDSKLHWWFSIQNLHLQLILPLQNGTQKVAENTPFFNPRPGSSPRIGFAGTFRRVASGGESARCGNGRFWDGFLLLKKGVGIWNFTRQHVEFGISLDFSWVWWMFINRNGMTLRLFYGL